MQQSLRLTDTSIGKKVAMAASGVILFGFAAGHLLGNLQVFKGAEAFNSYAEWLHAHPQVVYPTRILVLFSLGMHVWSAWTLWSRNSDARPTPYKKKQDLATNYAAQTMYATGPLFLAFVLFHLAHLTVSPEYGFMGLTEESPFANLVSGFQHWWIVAIYAVGVLCLGVHLRHGLWSMFQTIGASHPKYDRYRAWIANLFAFLITVGFLSIPAGVMANIVTL
ncbi:MAG: succinate dehydrogenase cytochrome b subunit [Deltaproteobacteria bacterium]|nr:succinate dehydrogenase cytochrome b subunit [Deltaproteobacteria bacterium]